MTKKVVFITAAAGAMGKSQAKLFAKNNYKVFLRPHFRIIRDSPDLINSIKKKFLKSPNFILHEGVTFDIIRSEGNYSEISLIDGKTGWIEQSEIGEI